MAYVNPVGQQQQQPVMQQEDPNKTRDMMLLASLMQPQQYQQPQQQQGGGGMGGLGSIASKFMGGGGGAASAGGGGAATGALSDFGAAGTGAISGGEVVGGTAGGGSAAGGGGGIMSSMAGWGPWAALAAAIIGNENQAVDKGYRSEGSDYWKDLATGEVLQQDITDRWGDKVFGDNKYGFGGDSLAGVQFSQGDFKQGWDTLRNQGTLAKLLGRDDDKHWTEY